MPKRPVARSRTIKRIVLVAGATGRCLMTRNQCRLPIAARVVWKLQLGALVSDA